MTELDTEYGRTAAENQALNDLADEEDALAADSG